MSDSPEPLPPEGVIDAALEAFDDQHPEIPIPLHRVEPPHELTPVERFDEVVDGWFERLRGTEPADRILYGLTELGDFGLIWLLLGYVRGLRSDDEARGALRLTAALAAESVLVNGLVKSQFKRERPVTQGPRPHKMRVPLTTSFPSGHSSTAMLAGALLTQKTSRPVTVAVLGLGGLVAISRVHVRIHHASDVAGGLVLGAALGAVARRLWPLYRR